MEKIFRVTYLCLELLLLLLGGLVQDFRLVGFAYRPSKEGQGVLGLLRLLVQLHLKKKSDEE